MAHTLFMEQDLQLPGEGSSCLTRDGTWALCFGSAVLTTEPLEKSLGLIFFFFLLSVLLITTRLITSFRLLLLAKFALDIQVSQDGSLDY